MGKYKLYFKKPELPSPPPGEWGHWLPNSIRENLKIITPILSIVALAVIILQFILFSANGELTAWLFPLVGNALRNYLRFGSKNGRYQKISAES
ncbi:MAG: hypothetical protein FWC09_11605 [Lachnospiraceae bacterium]|nr:hypothetical protein [Lachnospiraceae bacterium]